MARINCAREPRQVEDYMDQAAEILCNLVCFASKQLLVDFVSVPPIGHGSTGGGWREGGGAG